MTDDLVETLRRPNGILDWQYRIKCADRIEKLEKHLAFAHDKAHHRSRVIDSQCEHIKELEAALKAAIVWLDWDDEQQHAIVERARAVLQGAKCEPVEKANVNPRRPGSKPGE